MSLQARYTILRKIADGGTAEIFLATQRGVHGFEKVVVLKRIFPAYYADPQFRDMLVNEAHIAMSFNHSNIVQVLDLGEDDGQYILALELVDGWTLDAVIRRVRAARSSFPPALALYVTAEVCRGIAYAHAKTDADGKPLGIVHRDISPHNVLLSEQGEVKLTDFGIATLQEKNEQGSEKVIRGKIAFMSPEQARGGPIDARSDLFSVGTMLYVMICGRYPFDAPTDLEVLLLVKNGEAVPPEVARPGIHPEVSRLLKRALAKDPAERFQRADDMLLEVEQVMRAAFRAVGQTELKRWLQDLSARDGVPSVTKAPALPSSTPAGRVVGPSTPASTPNRIPPPPSMTRSGAIGRPPPPPAALSVGRKAAGGLPPGRPVTSSASRPGHEEDETIFDAPTPLPEVSSGPLPLADEPSAPHFSAAAADEVTRKSSPGVPAMAFPGDASAPEAAPRSESEAHAVPRSTAAALSARLTSGAGGRPTAPVPLPVFPHGPVVPPPPVSPEILAAVSGGESKPIPTAAKPAAETPAGPAPAGRRALLWAGAGVAALVVVIGSIKACGTHRHAPVATREATAPVTSEKIAERGGGGETSPAAARQPNAVAAGTAGTAGTAAEKSAAVTGAGGESPREAPSLAAAAGGSPAAAEPEKPAHATAPAASSPGEDGGAAPNGERVAERTEPSAPMPPPETAPAEESAPAASPDGGDAGTENKPKVSVSVTSVPPGAQLTTAHHSYGTTPARIHLRAGNGYALTFKLDGYRTLTKHVDITDEPEQEVSVTLRRTGGGSAPPKETPAPAPAPALAAPPPPPPKPRPKPDKSWWQKMFSR